MIKDFRYFFAGQYFPLFADYRRKDILFENPFSGFFIQNPDSDYFKLHFFHPMPLLGSHFHPSPSPQFDSQPLAFLRYFFTPASTARSSSARSRTARARSASTRRPSSTATS
jgi:hypothetical protein